MSEANPLGAFFRDHLRELRRRVAIAFAAVVLFTVIAYAFSDGLTVFLLRPIFQALPHLQGLVYTSLPEAFIAYFKVSLLAGVAAALPIILYQIWMFVSPGLRAGERRVALLVVFWATLLFVTGVLFAYLVVLPKILQIMLGAAGERLLARPRLDDYLSFVARTVLCLGLAFEIPFLMVAAGKIGLVAPDFFRGKRWVSYGALVGLAFLLVAGDFLSALLLALPLVLLYELGGVAVLLLCRKPHEQC
ncbi:MAG: twin-arginine translocase subunit TatC [Desulfobulbaceae bacterium]|nr:twin-arginine translocase subunit TatC [Desulfobulbaceae bacterium]